MSSLTECGLPGIRQIPYGVHMCHFYESREELAAALVPYFLAGLRVGERCIWITAAPLDAADAKRALRAAGFDVQAAIARGDLVVRDYDEWYEERGNLRGSQVVELWLAEEARALADGYRGLRITGNTSFLTPQTFPEFLEYEALVDRVFHGRRIVTLCTYSLAGCDPADIIDVRRCHGCTLDHPDEGWQILT